MPTTANTNTALIRTLLARYMPILKNAVPALGLVRKEFNGTERQKGSAITIPVSSPRPATPVTPAEVPSAPVPTTTTYETISLDKWYENSFHLSDQEKTQFMENENFRPMETEEAFYGLAKQMNKDLLDSIEGRAYNYVGTGGTPPFGTPGIDDAIDCIGHLDSENVPDFDRFFVLGNTAHIAALKLDEFHQAHIRGSDETIRTGRIGQALGAEWYRSSYVPYHTAGTLKETTGNTMKAAINANDVAVGDTSVALDEGAYASLTGTIKKGDIFTVAGDSQEYVVTADATVVTTDVTISFLPAAKVAWADDSVVTFKGAYTANLCFQRGGIAMVNVPLPTDNPNAVVMRDPETGLYVRVVIDHQHRQTAYYFDVLYGVRCVQPARVTILAG